MPTAEEMRAAYVRAGCNLSIARGFLPPDATENAIIAALAETPEASRAVAEIERSMTRVRIHDVLNRALMVLTDKVANLDERSLLRLLPALLEAHAAGMPATQLSGMGGGQQNTFNMLLQVLPPDARQALLTLHAQPGATPGAPEPDAITSVQSLPLPPPSAAPGP